MVVTKNMFEIFFSVALFVNAILFIPQAIQIVSEKTTKGVSLITFLGFLLIQFAIVLHGIITKNYLLMGGYIVSLLTCGSVVVLILIYRRHKETTEINTLTLEEILAQLPGHIYWKDKSCVFGGSNINNWKDFGCTSLTDYKGKTDYDMLPKKEALQVRMVDEEVMRTGQLKVTEEFLTKPKGEKALYLSHKAPLKNIKNEIVGIAGVSVDITTAKQKTLDQLEMLENIIAIMPGHVYWVDKEGYYLGCNDNQAKSAGLTSRSEIVGKSNKDLPWNFNVKTLPEDLDKINKQVIRTGMSVSLEEPAILQDGTKAVYLSNKVPLRNRSNEIIVVVGISIDITDRKTQEQELKIAKEAAEESDKIKSDFISNMEHDIRTPFIGVYGMIDIMAKEETDPEKKSLLNQVSVCAKELMDYCDSILDFSRIQAESQPIVTKSFNLRKVTDSIITMEMIAAKHKQLDLQLNYDDSLPTVVMGDPHRLKRILINLVSNAIKFTEKGYVKLSVSYEKDLSNSTKSVIKFIVEDTGIGIPDDKKALIFERFTKIIPSHKGLYKGLGLGLRIVKQYVSELGGDIHLKSKIGQGSTFILFLPFKIPLSDEIIDEE